mgnify:FL=1
MCLINAEEDGSKISIPCETFAIVAWDITYVAEYQQSPFLTDLRKMWSIAPFFRPSYLNICLATILKKHKGVNVMRHLSLLFAVALLSSCATPQVNTSYLKDESRGSGGIIAFCRTPPNLIATFIYQKIYIDSSLVGEVEKGKALSVPVNIGETVEVKLKDKTNILDSGDLWLSEVIEEKKERYLIITPKTNLSAAASLLLGPAGMAAMQEHLKPTYFTAQYVSKDVFDQNCGQVN